MGFGAYTLRQVLRRILTAQDEVWAGGFMSRNENGAAANGKGNGANGNDYKVPTGRAEWIVRRKAEAERTGDRNMSQMHFARKGMITEEMAFVAQKEKISPELVRSEVAKGTMIIPANINHPALKP